MTWDSRQDLSLPLRRGLIKVASRRSADSSRQHLSHLVTLQERNTRTV